MASLQARPLQNPLSLVATVTCIILSSVSHELKAQPAPSIAPSVMNCSAAGKEPIDIASPGSGRIALIITNQNYPVEVGRLEATHNDGETVCKALVALGFSVRHVKDADLETFQREIQGYKHRLSRLEGIPGERASFFYFSGHGAAAEEGGANYLIPVAASIRRRADLVVQGVNLDELIKQVQETARQFQVISNFVIIDACRNPAFAAGSRSTARGFTPVAEQSGVMVAFSTAPGRTAVDADFYSKALARELQVPNRDAFLAFREVRRSVLNATNGHQFPWTHDGLINEFIFVTDANAPTKQASSAPAGRPILIEDDKPVLVDCNVCPRLRRIDPPAPAPGSTEPLIRSYALGMHEVTFEDWQACIDDRACAGLMPSDSGFGRGKHPVINVSRAEVQLYVDWLNKRSGQSYPYRLPTEPEWDYAARDGKPVALINDADAKTLCTFAHASLPVVAGATACAEHSLRGTLEVGRLKPNPAGLYDMAGNVWEWVETCFADRSSPRSTGDPCDRVLRGGSWHSGIDDLKIAARKRAPIALSGRTIGFRVARDVD
jgi:Sulfatase-modifying factor enzyme 1/Caspase domain